MADKAEAFVNDFFKALSDAYVTVDSKAPSRADELKSLQDAAGGLRQDLNKHADILPKHDLSRCERELHALEQRLAQFQKDIDPRPKFTLRRQGSARTEEEKQPPPSASNAPGTDSTALKDTMSGVPDLGAARMSNLEEVYIGQLEREAESASSLSLSRLRKSMFDVRADYSSAYVDTCAVSLLVIDRVTGGILLRNLRNCVIVVRAHQIRIHDSTNCLFLIDSPGEAIVEGCTNVRFGALSTQSTRAAAASSDKQAPVLRIRDFSNPLDSEGGVGKSWQMLDEDKHEELMLLLSSWADLTTEQKKQRWADMRQDCLRYAA